METFSNEINMRLSQETDAIMSLMHSRINRAISSTISEKVIPEIQNIVRSMSSENRDTETRSSIINYENRDETNGL